MTTTIPQVQERKATLSGVVPDAESRTVTAALSSEAPVERFFGTEILSHDDSAINLERADGNGIPLLINHDAESLPIGRIRNLRVEDKVLRGDLTFSEATEPARQAWDLAREGTLSDISVRYSIDKYEIRGSPDDDREEYRVTEWTLLEGSVVSVPADPSVGIGRSQDEGTIMPEETPAPTVPETPTPVENATASRRAGEQAGIVAERARQTDIDLLAANFPDNPAVQDLARSAKQDGHSVEAFKDQMLTALSGGPATPLAAPNPTPQHVSRSIQGGQTGVEKFRAGVEEALNISVGNIKGPEAAELARQNEYAGLTIIEMARMALEMDGLAVRGMSAMDVAGAVLARYIDPGTANLTTTNFPAILENVLNKALFAGFEEAPVTWNIWAGVDSSADFKQATRPGLSQFTSLEVVAENAAIQDGIVNDKKEQFTIQTWARKFSVTRQTLVNDDLSALADVANRMGRAAGRTVDEQVYAFIVANGNMVEDGQALFSAAAGRADPNKNLDATATQDPSTTTIGQTRARMARFTDSNNITLGIVPQFMVVPMELEQTMLELSTLNADPVRVRRDNVYRTLWTPVATPRLSNTRTWYMFGAQGDGVRVAFLNGAQAPMMARDEGWSVLSAHWRVVLDFTVFAVDFRNGYQWTNPAS